MRSLRSIPPVLGTVLLASCAGSMTLGDRMFDHFTRAGQIQSALIVGDLNGARRSALWIAEYEGFSDLASGSEARVADLRAASRAVAEAPSIDEAASAAGRLAAVCADCHTSADDGPRFRVGTQPPASDSRARHMILHLWAVDRMWEGLIAGSDELWRLGTRVIAQDEPEGSFEGGSAAAALAETLHGQAAEAERLSVPQRPAAYAEMIKTCSGCHSVVGVGAD